MFSCFIDALAFLNNLIESSFPCPAHDNSGFILSVLVCSTYPVSRKATQAVVIALSHEACDNLVNTTIASVTYLGTVSYDS